MFNIIEHNPYRYLGVYSNSSNKERVANQGKINAFLKVGKLITFPLDLDGLLPPINRTTENVVEATSKLARYEDQIRYAQFWWIYGDNSDNMAFEYLFENKTNDARYIWELIGDIPSIQNRIVLSLIKQDYKTAICLAEDLYVNHADEFLSLFSDIDRINEKLLFQNFLDELMKDALDQAEIKNYINNEEWKTYIENKSIAPIINEIKSAISISQSSRGDDPEECYKAGEKLIKSTESLLVQLKTYISEEDSHYVNIVDKLAEEILQCSIDYYNNSNDYDRALKAQKLHTFAQSIARGEYVLQRLLRNGEIIDRAAVELPPIKVIEQCELITQIVNELYKIPPTIPNAKKILKKTRPILRSMKRVLGKSHKLYIATSTNVVNDVLSIYIDEVNEIQKSFLSRRKVKKTLRQVWLGVEYMKWFKMDEKYKLKRYKPNRSALKKICNNYDVSTPIKIYGIPIWIYVTLIIFIVLGIYMSFFKNYGVFDGFICGFIWAFLAALAYKALKAFLAFCDFMNEMIRGEQ